MAEPHRIQLGIYQHYKGPLYQVIGIAHDANADTLGIEPRRGEETIGYEDVTVKPFGQRTVVVYMPLQLDGAHFGPRMAVRTVEDFRTYVCPVETCPEYGKANPPFTGPNPHLSFPSYSTVPEMHRTVRRFVFQGPEYTETMWRRLNG